MAWLNHWNSTVSHTTKPTSKQYAPQPAPFTH